MISIFFYVNILFACFTIYYLFTLFSSFSLTNSFYLLFSLFCIACSSLLFLTYKSYRSTFEKRIYQLLFSGFLVYGFSNFVWYLDSILLKSALSIDFLNFGFIYQVLTKFLFFFIIKYQFERQKNCLSVFLRRVLQVNILFLILALVFQGSTFSETKVYEYFFIFESIFTIFYLIFELRSNVKYLLDIRIFIIGSVVWLLGDILFFFENFLNQYRLGSLSDFTFFLGFYFFIYSIFFKNYSIKKELLRGESSKNLKYRYN